EVLAWFKTGFTLGARHQATFLLILLAKVANSGGGSVLAIFGGPLSWPPVALLIGHLDPTIATGSRHACYIGPAYPTPPNSNKDFADPETCCHEPCRGAHVIYDHLVRSARRHLGGSRSFLVYLKCEMELQR